MLKQKELPWDLFAIMLTVALKTLQKAKQIVTQLWNEPQLCFSICAV